MTITPEYLRDLADDDWVYDNRQALRDAADVIEWLTVKVALLEREIVQLRLKTEAEGSEYRWGVFLLHPTGHYPPKHAELILNTKDEAIRIAALLNNEEERYVVREV